MIYIKWSTRESIQTDQTLVQVSLRCIPGQQPLLSPATTWFGSQASRGDDPNSHQVQARQRLQSLDRLSERIGPSTNHGNARKDIWLATNHIPKRHTLGWDRIRGKSNQLEQGPGKYLYLSFGHIKTVDHELIIRYNSIQTKQSFGIVVKQPKLNSSTDSLSRAVRSNLDVSPKGKLPSM